MVVSPMTIFSRALWTFEPKSSAWDVNGFLIIFFVKNSYGSVFTLEYEKCSMFLKYEWMNSCTHVSLLLSNFLDSETRPPTNNEYASVSRASTWLATVSSVSDDSSLYFDNFSAWKFGASCSSPIMNSFSLARVNATKSIRMDSSPISSWTSMPTASVIEVVIASMKLVLFEPPPVSDGR